MGEEENSLCYYYYVQSQLGHASIQTTMDRYVHLMPVDKYNGAGVRLDEKVFGEVEERNLINQEELLRCEKQLFIGTGCKFINLQLK